VHAHKRRRARNAAEKRYWHASPREVVQKPLPPLVGWLLPSIRSDRPFAMNRFPLLPREEEGRLNDMGLRENFIERVFGLRRKAELSAWQFASGKLHECMDGDARQAGHAWRPGPYESCIGHLCLRTSAGRPVPHSPQAEPRSRHRLALRHGPRPLGKPSALALPRDGPPCRRRRQAELGRTHRRVRAMLMEGLGVMGTRGKHVNARRV
jgi:hypothetical protein